MLEDVEWIRNKLVADNTKTKRGLAKALGVHPSAISRLLSGARQLKYGEAKKAAIYLGGSLLGNPEPSNQFSEPPTSFDYSDNDNIAALAPVFETRIDASGAVYLDRGARIDQKARAPHFTDSAKVFGFYVKDERMSPRFKPGEIAWVDPARPVRAGDDVVLSLPISANLAEIVLSELERTTASHWHVIEHCGSGKTRFEVASWRILHVLPRY